MKTLKLILFAFVFSIIFYSCKKKDSATVVTFYNCDSSYSTIVVTINGQSHTIDRYLVYCSTPDKEDATSGARFRVELSPGTYTYTWVFSGGTTKSGNVTLSEGDFTPIEITNTSTGNCIYTTYSGGSCSAASDVRVSSSTCCPSNTPYYCSNTNQCFSTCEGAATVCNGSIVLGTSGSGNCDYTDYTGSGSCTAGNVLVSSSTCCPSSTPFYCSNTNQCYTTCSAADAQCSGNVVKGSSGSTNCDYTDYTGSGSCTAGNVLVSSGTCCPSSSPFYCSNTNQCYTTCSAADAQCSGSVMHGTSGGSGGCNWNSAASCVSIVLSEHGTRCGDPQSYEITLRNICNQNVKMYVCLKRTDGTWDGLPDGTFLVGMAPSETKNWYVCQGTGAYEIFTMPASDFSANGCTYPDCN